MTRRREVLKFVALGGAGLALTGHRAHAQICTAEIDPLPTVSPATTPFISPLFILPKARPVSRLYPPPVPSQHQLYQQYPPKKFYNFDVTEFPWEFHPQLPKSLVWGYQGTSPGPMIVGRYGEPILVRMNNKLPADHTGFGTPSITTHMHNMHAAAESDGFPDDYIDTGYYHDHHYANFPAGGDWREMLATLWYHDHMDDYTAANVYKGLYGSYILYNELDSGDERDQNPNAFRLPGGDYDVPLLLMDRAFDNNGELYFDVFNTDGVLGDKMTVNGIVTPYFQVEPRKYRLRFVNSCPSRFLTLKFDNVQPVVLSSDGNLLPEPYSPPNIPLAMAQRVDVIVDFSQVPFGSSVTLTNILYQISGRGPEIPIQYMNPGDPVMRFDVVKQLRRPDMSVIPATMIPLPQIDLSSVRRHRLFEFDYFNGSWLINDKVYDRERIDAAPLMNSAEIWTLRNMGSGWSHPIHIHLEEHRVLRRNGQPIQPGTNDFGRKDIVWLGPKDEVQIFMQFRDFYGHYVMHCHNIVHEDHAMMIRWDSVANELDSNDEDGAN